VASIILSHTHTHLGTTRRLSCSNRTERRTKSSAVFSYYPVPSPRFPFSLIPLNRRSQAQRNEKKYFFSESIKTGNQHCINGWMNGSTDRDLGRLKNEKIACYDNQVGFLFFFCHASTQLIDTPV